MKQRILIVEDEPAIADNLVYALETEGFSCRWCATAGEGLAALGPPGEAAGSPTVASVSAADASGPATPGVVPTAADGGAAAPGFALAILDVGLPDMNGFDLCRAIRRRHDLPILFLTARAGEIDRVVGLELGADDYVVKPFSPREVAARVKAILRRSSRGGPGTAGTRADALPAPATRPGADAGAHPPPFDSPFRHDAERKRIAYFGKVLELSRNEYRLLAVLLEKPGRVWSREQLMEKAWDSPESSLERTVDAHVKSLRAKLREAKPGVEAIVTHRGLGYSLAEDW